MRNGMATLLWEQGVTHIKVTEAGLEEVILAAGAGGWDTSEAGSSAEEAKKARTGNAASFSARPSSWAT